MTAFRPNNTWYVATNGNDTTHSGGPLQPFLTISKAITTVNALSTTVPQVIYVNPGSYNEAAPVVITRGRVSVRGAAASDSVNNVCSLTCPSVTINITSGGSTANNQVVWEGMTIVQTSSASDSLPLISDVSTAAHGLVLKNMQLYGRNSAIDFQPLADARLYIDECEILQSGVPVASVSPLVSVRGGAAQLYRASLTTIQNATVLDVTTAAALWTAAFCAFQSATTSANAEPLVRLRSEVSFPSSIQYCSFVYTDTTVKNPLVTRGIEFGGDVAQQLVLVNCYFALLGLGYEGRVVDVNGLGVHQLYTNGCYALPETAYGVNASVVKLLPVNPQLGV